MVGTSTSAPSATSVNFTGASSRMSLSTRSKSLWGRTFARRIRSPRGPPLAPAGPSPRSMIFRPVSTPAGTFTLIRRFLRVSPEPPQSLQRPVTCWPVPWHWGHAAERFMDPPACCVKPEPPHALQALVGPPTPPQVWQRSERVRLIDFCAPCTASSKGMSSWCSMVSPFRAAVGPARPGPVLACDWAVRPKMSPNTSANPKPPAPAPPPKFRRKSSKPISWYCPDC